MRNRETECGGQDVNIKVEKYQGVNILICIS